MAVHCCHRRRVSEVGGAKYDRLDGDEAGVRQYADDTTLAHCAVNEFSYSLKQSRLQTTTTNYNLSRF